MMESTSDNKSSNAVSVPLTNENTQVEPDSGYRKREQWANKFEFIFSCMAFSIGLGNVWRFPYLCFKNGGGAFFIPYMICLVAGGVPIYFMEVAIGQYWQEGGITVWQKICPLLKGIGYGTSIISFILNIYYIVILAWALLYLYYSFSPVLPWATCNNPWNTPNCFTGSSVNSVVQNTSAVTKDAAVEFWEREILQISDGINSVGGLQPKLVISLAVAWILCFFCIWRGIKSTGKSAYVTALFPYVMLVILFIRGITLPGAGKGITFYMKPEFDKLMKVQVWIDAGTQIFFSYAIALGTMTALGSYNDFHNNFYHGTSIFAGFAIFSVLGFMAHQQGVDVANVADKGPGLAFIAYPKGVSVMPGAPIWAVLFFLMIILLGLGSQVIKIELTVEGFVTAIVDMYPQFLRVGRRREYFISFICFISFILGLSMVTRGGMYVFQIFDFYGASGMCLLWMSFFECVTIAWLYGADRFRKNIKEMIGMEISVWFIWCWKYLTPLLTAAIFIVSIFLLEPIKYNNTYVYPSWAIAFGWFLSFSSMIAIPVYIIYALIVTPGDSIKKKLEILMKRSPSSFLEDKMKMAVSSEKHNDAKHKVDDITISQL
uniref:Transporter n=1 Tax=Tetranychus urticae TaxID=32264 RepID=T1KML9_TETUR